ncbi:DUF2267 domain-containing protein [Streptomyces litchfieldiae]|uniref:DUF2267 domain-containing protein n=1 Tax=Streptomyces litchfieldiae TaxID=3075543 RepID=A0ABU2MXK1_9ACTN|nr:DUF2267 domain-containing protein [Streptomyces sp. DSM 44938]MDT0346370.1 DUF2267 domain-containing protein [Streptomyces sp. DSM 44938]
MSYGSFLSTVRDRGEYPGDEAERAVEAVLTTLGERLPSHSAEHLADQLPTPLAQILENADGAGRSWGVEEFITHVAQRADEDEETAETDTRVVFSVISEQVTGGEMNKLLSQLPTGYAELFGYSELA